MRISFSLVFETILNDIQSNLDITFLSVSTNLNVISRFPLYRDSFYFISGKFVSGRYNAISRLSVISRSVISRFDCTPNNPAIMCNLVIYITTPGITFKSRPSCSLTSNLFPASFHQFTPRRIDVP